MAKIHDYFRGHFSHITMKNIENSNLFKFTMKLLSVQPKSLTLKSTFSVSMPTPTEFSPAFNLYNYFDSVLPRNLPLGVKSWLDVAAKYIEENNSILSWKRRRNFFVLFLVLIDWYECFVKCLALYNFRGNGFTLKFLYISFVVQNVLETIFQRHFPNPYSGHTIQIIANEKCHN